MRPIKFFQSDYAELKPEFDAAIQGVLNSGEFIQGEQVRKLERGICDYLKVNHCITCANGTDALTIAMMALPVGTEVIMPAFNYIAAAEAATLLGLKPVFVDVDPATYCIDVDCAAMAINDNTRCIIVTHLFGHCVDMAPFMALSHDTGVKIIEDFAQAFGSRNQAMAGTFGNIGITSFFPTKNLGCFGDGGAIVTHDGYIAEQCRMIANHGQRTRYSHELIGMNSRLDEIQAAVLNVKLEYIDADLQIRRDIADFYSDNLDAKKYNLPFRSEGHTYHQYTMMMEHGHDVFKSSARREKFVNAMRESGIPIGIYYHAPSYMHPCYSYDHAVNGKDCAVAELISRHVVSIPIHPCMDQVQMEYIVKTLNTYKG